MGDVETIMFHKELLNKLADINESIKELTRTMKEFGSYTGVKDYD